MPGLSHALVPAQESKRWSFGRLLLLPVIQKGLFLGPKKSRKIRHANTGLPSITCVQTVVSTLETETRAKHYFFCARARCLSAGLRYLRLTRLPRHDRGLPGGNRSAASCPCTVLRRASCHYATRSPKREPNTNRECASFVKLCTAKLCLENQNKTYRDQSYPKAFPQINKRESNFPCPLTQITPDNKQRFNTHSVSLARA